SKFDKKLDGILMQRADNGGISMTSWVMPWLFKGDSVKIWLNAGREERAKRIANRDEISLEEARKIVDKRDKENRGHYKNLYGYELDKDLEVFDLIVDTDGIEPDDIMKEIDTYIKSKMGDKK
ncbi:MAG: cytidylate kinase family protein, partial [Candidatus Aenigmatarchaeota archaeon]